MRNDDSIVLTQKDETRLAEIYDEEFDLYLLEQAAVPDINHAFATAMADHGLNYIDRNRRYYYFDDTPERPFHGANRSARILRQQMVSLAENMQDTNYDLGRLFATSAEVNQATIIEAFEQLIRRLPERGMHMEFNAANGVTSFVPVEKLTVMAPQKSAALV